MAAPQSYDNIQQVPCVVPFTSRDAGPTSDAYMKNCYVESTGEAAYAVKRNGLQATVNIGALVSSGPGFPNKKGQGILGSDQGGYLTFVMDDTVGFLSLTNVMTSVAIPSGSIVTPLCPFRMIPYNFGLAPIDSIIQAEALFYVTPFFTGACNLLVTSALSGYLVPSLCELNQTYYLMTSFGRIYSTADINTWTALAYIALDSILGQPLCLVRHLSYLIAFCSKGAVAYYDAGISPGSPLAPVQNAVWLEGMAVDGAQTIATTIEDELFWVGAGQSTGYTVSMMSGLTITTVSSEAVNRVLEKYMPLVATANGASISGYQRTVYPRGLAFKSGGHSFYVLTFPAFTSGGTAVPGISMAYDIAKKHWSIWSQQYPSGTELEWLPWFVTARPGFNSAVFIDRTTGFLTALSETIYQDLGNPIKMQIQTELFNWGNQRTKMIPATYLQADTMTSNVTVQWSDDDYNTYNTGQVVATDNPKKQMIRCGSTTQRGWMLTHTDNTPMRLYGLEVEVVPGAL